jgi:hypothetical protein
MQEFGGVIGRLADEVFGELPLSEEAQGKLRMIAGSLVSKDRFPVDVSGVVIAGFGEEEAFPSLRSFVVEGVVKNRLKYKQRESFSVTHSDRACIIPFAQREMVVTLMEGVDPNYREATEAWLSEVLTKYPDVVAGAIPKIDEEAKQKLRLVSSQILGDYLKRMESYRREKYVDPVINVVSMLPKVELAAMAETFVSLTSFKRRVTIEMETVGGPIDVAVISKGDGFIWIKRKHYFKAELNVRFLAKCFKEGEHGSK